MVCSCSYLLLYVVTHFYAYLVSTYECRSDPTENDSVEGLRPNARGPGLVTFGVCIF